MKKHKRWFLISAAVVLLLALLCAWLLFFVDMSYHITVSKETTLFTEPLFADGRVDYGAALNAINGQGVTAESNAAVPFGKLVGDGWQDSWEPKMFALLCEQLGVSPAEMQAGSLDIVFLSYTDSRDKYIDEKMENIIDEPDQDPAMKDVVEAIDPIESLRDEINEAEYILSFEPWSVEKYPYADYWLKQNEEAMAVAARAIDRPHWFFPLVTSEENPLFGALLPLISGQRGIARAFAARAMQRIEKGQLEEAWQDIRTVRRLARHVATEPFLVSYLVAITVDRLVFNPTAALLSHKSLDDARRREIIAEIEQQGPLPQIADSSALTGELCFGLEAIQLFPAYGARMLDFTADFDEVSPYDRAVRNVMRRRVNWDEILKRYNAHYKELTEALAGPNRPARIREIEAAIAKEIPDRGLGEPTLANLLFSRDPTERVYKQITGMILAAYTHIARAEDKLVVRQRILDLVGRLACYRASKGEYPDTLDALLAEPLDLPPADASLLDDPFTETDQLKYMKNPDGETGCLIYSVGQNGTDDGGRWDWEFDNSDADTDDIAVRVGPKGYVPPSVWNVDPPEEEEAEGEEMRDGI